MLWVRAQWAFLNKTWETCLSVDQEQTKWEGMSKEEATGYYAARWH